jgi:hypothetical protein
VHCVINTLRVSLPHPLNGLCGAFALSHLWVARSRPRIALSHLRVALNRLRVASGTPPGRLYGPLVAASITL